MNNTMFSLQFLGSGNARSKPPVNYNTNVLVRSNAHTWLIDCGLLCPLAMHHFHVPQNQIEGVFVSHLHGDHVLGLEELCLTRFFKENTSKFDLFLPAGLRCETGAPDGYDIWENCLRASLETSIPTQSGEKRLTLNDYANIHTLYPDRSYQIYDLTCKPFIVNHVKNRPAYGLIIDNRVAFTADCTFDEKCIKSLMDQNIETIFHDVSFTTGSNASLVHTSFEQLAQLPRQISEHIILMHYGDETTDAQFKTAESLGFRIARPGMIFEF